MAKRRYRRSAGKSTDVRALLSRIRDIRDTETDPDIVQAISPPQAFDKGVPTLARGKYQAVTPMLAVRFEFAGTWANAFPGERWLGISDMRKVWRDKAIREQIDQRREYWEGCAPATYPRSRLSLFSVSEGPDEESEVYLVWPEEPGAEPSVAWYIGGSGQDYPHLAAYLNDLIAMPGMRGA